MRSISIDTINCDSASGVYTVRGTCSDPTRVYAELRGFDPLGGPGTVSPLLPIQNDGGTGWSVEFLKRDLEPTWEYEVFAALADGEDPPINDTKDVPPC